MSSDSILPDNRTNGSQQPNGLGEFLTDTEQGESQPDFSSWATEVAFIASLRTLDDYHWALAQGVDREVEWPSGTRQGATTVGWFASLHSLWGLIKRHVAETGRLPEPAFLREQDDRYEPPAVLPDRAWALAQLRRYTRKRLTNHAMLEATKRIDDDPEGTHAELAEWLTRIDALVGEPVKNSALPWATMAEILSSDRTRAEWVVQNVAALGNLTEITSQIKRGKTTFTLDFSREVLTGGLFLGRFLCRRTGIVYLSEEGYVTLRAAAERLGYAPEQAEAMHILARNETRDGYLRPSALSWEELVAAAAAHCQTVGAQLLIVDTLSRWSGVEDENGSTEADQRMDVLADAARSAGIAVVALRHAGHRGIGANPADAGRGSSAWGGSFDLQIAIERKRDGLRQAKWAQGRLITEELDVTFTLDPEQRRLVETEAAVDADALALLDVIPEEPTKSTEIADAAGLTSRQLNTQVKPLVDSGLVTGEKRGRAFYWWRLPEPQEDADDAS